MTPAPATRLSLSYDPPGATLKAFRASPATVRALIGPVQAGRKTCAVYDILLRAGSSPQRRWRWAVIAANDAALETAIDVWHSVVPKVGFGDWDAKALRHQFGFAVPAGGPGGRMARPKDLDLQFFAADRGEHRKRLAALEASGIWLVGARELDEGIFDQALAAAGSWPLDEPPAPAIILTSRMPDEAHWLAKRSDDGGEIARFRQPGGRTTQAENIRNLKPGFYRRLAAGRNPEWVRVHVDAEFSLARKSGSLEDAILRSYQEGEQAA